MANFTNNLPAIALGSRVLTLTNPYTQGTDVKVFQRLYDTMLEIMMPPRGSMGARIAIDGVFGPQTQAAVINVQTYFGTHPDGCIGDSTYCLMGQDNTAYSGPPFGSRPLSLGLSGGDVKVLQNRLNCLRYAEVINQPADGLFGPDTMKGLIAFQGDNVVFRHWDIASNGAAQMGTMNITWITALVGGRNLSEGVNGFDTAGLQTILQNLAMYHGCIDGYFGSATLQALKDFQRTAAIRVDGIAGPQTYFALGQTNRVFWYSPDERPRSLINSLHDITEISSTIDPVNGDNNPYGIAIAPNTYADGHTVLKRGDLLVSNINNSAGVMGLGTTVERIVHGHPVRFFAKACAAIALAVSNLGPPWIADFGLAPDGAQGVVQVITPNGTEFSGSNIHNPLFDGPWGMEFNFGELYDLPVAFFSTNVLCGTLTRLSHFHPPDFSTDTVVEEIASGFSHTGTVITDVYGPQGLVWTPMGDTLFVADGADHRVAALSPVSVGRLELEDGQTVYQGAPLDKPAGMAWNPENGHLIVVNQGDNRAVEINPRTGRVNAIKILDKTPVNPVTGAGSALFGVATAVNDEGDLVLYFTNDNTNTVNCLAR